MLHTGRLLPTPRLGRVALCGLLALGVAGCGEDGSPTDAGPQRDASASSTPTDAPTQSPSAEPLSAYEDAPQVEVARKWAAAAARDVSAGKAQLPTARKFMSEKGHQVVPTRFSQEVGLTYPGPVPFTPVAVRSDGDVVTCMWVAGWGRDKATDEPAEKKKIAAMRIDLDRIEGQWQVSDLLTSEADCSGIDVQGVTW